MPGRGFLEVARDLVAGPTEYPWRTAVVSGYYALVLECRDALLRWGFALPPRVNMHAWVRLRFTYTTDPDLRAIGKTLDPLVQRRNKASYDLQSIMFSSSLVGQDTIKEATAAVALLDQIEADPARLAAAIAAVRP
jgi:hypothetical protein